VCVSNDRERRLLRRTHSVKRKAIHEARECFRLGWIFNYFVRNHTA
jgi:hypothetical protein